MKATCASELNLLRNHVADPVLNKGAERAKFIASTLHDKDSVKRKAAAHSYTINAAVKSTAMTTKEQSILKSGIGALSQTTKDASIVDDDPQRAEEESYRP
jgi:hypothetical protein